MFAIGQEISPPAAKALAVEVAQQGAGFVSPNPLVGCVIVDSKHHFLASGYHARYGGAHAEADAFSKVAGQDLTGATVYVTLEPCSHYGKTPPCALLFREKGIRRVVVGLKDPNPMVSGRGLEILRQENIEIVFDEEFSRSCSQLSEIFLHHIQQRTPFVALKVAMSADGKIARPVGQSQWITGEEARFMARELRAHYDATLIGAETFLRDNPRLDFRQTRWDGTKEPKVVILDPRGRAEQFFPQSALAKQKTRESVFFIKDISAEMLADLYQKGLFSLYVEGGAETHRLFIDRGLFQKIYCFSSSQIIGDGLIWREGVTPLNLGQKLSLLEIRRQKIGNDEMIELSKTRRI